MNTTVEKVYRNEEDNNLDSLNEFDKSFEAMKNSNCFKKTVNMSKIMEGQKGEGEY